MDLSTALVHGVWGGLAASVILRLRRQGAAAFDERLTDSDRRLVGASAFFLAVPLTVLLSQLAQVGLVKLAGAELGPFEAWVYWGSVQVAPGEPVRPLVRAGIAAAGPTILLSVAGVALAWTARSSGRAALNLFRLELARALLILALGVHPIASLLVAEGDFWAIREALNQRHPQSGDLALLGYGILGAYAFWKWRGAQRLRMLGTAMHDAGRRARDRLALAPDDPEALIALGAAQLAAGETSSMELLQKARALAPEDPRVELLLGRAHLDHGRARAASEHLRQAGLLAEERQPPDRDLLFEITLALSAARIALGDGEGAILTAESARCQSPSDPRALLMHADALVAGGQLEEARHRLERALDSAQGLVRREIERRLAALRRG